jgi:sugar/nucleoside kinase (ribokinase family)
MGKTAVAAGHICLDLTPILTDTKARVITDVLKPGSLTDASGIDIHTGGSVANTGLAMKMLGADVRLIAKIGRDSLGCVLRGCMNEISRGSDRDLIVSEACRTSYSVVVAIPGIDRLFIHDSAANDDFGFDDIDFEKLRGTSLFHFGYPSHMSKMFADGGNELVRIFRKAKEEGMATSLDFAAISRNSRAGSADWRKILERTVPCVDFMVPSVGELGYMLSPELYDSWVRRADGRDVTEILDPERDIRPLADELLSMGAKAILIKCGKPGIYFRSAGKDILDGVGANLSLDAESWADREFFEKSFRPDRVLSGTGAGDTAIAAFLTSVLNGKGPEESVRIAAAAGAASVTEYDALSGLLPIEELEEKIRNGWEKAGG